ncbi:MAG: hypothetical protein F6K39_20825 [Okeania sp. SIO3B3]|nr:hypothetical protein [Okeania sp. SIO3B3]
MANIIISDLHTSDINYLNDLTEEEMEMIAGSGWFSIALSAIGLGYKLGQKFGWWK